MANTQHDADIINEERTRQRIWMQEKLSPLGVEVSIAHYTGDSSYPTEYTLKHPHAIGSGPTFDLALLDFIEHMLKLVNDAHSVAGTYAAMESALQVLSGNIVGLRTEFLAVKAGAVSDEDVLRRLAEHFLLDDKA